MFPFKECPHKWWIFLWKALKDLRHQFLQILCVHFLFICYFKKYLQLRIEVIVQNPQCSLLDTVYLIVWCLPMIHPDQWAITEIGYNKCIIEDLTLFVVQIWSHARKSTHFPIRFLAEGFYVIIKQVFWELTGRIPFSYELLHSSNELCAAHSHYLAKRFYFCKGEEAL